MEIQIITAGNVAELNTIIDMQREQGFIPQAYQAVLVKVFSLKPTDNGQDIIGQHERGVGIDIEMMGLA